MKNTTIFTILVSGTLLAMPSSAAQRWGNERIPDSGACFYQYPDFRGPYFCARAGEDLPVIPNAMTDRIASIRVFGGAQLVAYSYDRFDGAQVWFDYDVPDLRYQGWDDRIASVRVGMRPPRGGRWDERLFGGGPRGDVGGQRDRYRSEAPGYRGEAPGGGREFSNRAATTREQAQAIVRAAYLAVLKREPDPGSAGWVDRVLNDHWTQQDIERGLRDSPEYKAKNPGR